MQHLIISCSLSPTSRSAILAGALADAIRKIADQVELIDLRQWELPFCDADACYAHPNVKRLQQAIADAAAVTLAVPIYNYGVGGAARNVVALTGKVWTDKIVGFVCAAGGQGSYMSVMNIANSLMLDFRSIVVPRFVYATGKAFDDDRVHDPDLADRIDQLARELHRFAAALA